MRIRLTHTFRIVCFALAPLLMVALGMVASVQGQSTELDESPVPGESNMMNVASWERRILEGGTDYITLNIRTDRLPVNIREGTANSDCVGFTSDSAMYEIVWNRRSISEDESLRLFFVSGGDTTLAIRQPNGRWLCSDDSYQTIHPTVNITHPRTGSYLIWVGAKTRNSNVDGRLYVTLQDDYTPRVGDYPTEPTERFMTTNPGSGSSDAQIIYVDSYNTTSGCEISLDLRFTGMTGEAIRVRVVPVVGTRVVQQEALLVEMIPDNFVAIYDYSVDGEPPVDVRFRWNNLDSDVRTFKVEVVLEQQTRNNWQSLTSYRTPTPVCRQ